MSTYTPAVQEFTPAVEHVARRNRWSRLSGRNADGTYSIMLDTSIGSVHTVDLETRLCSCTERSEPRCVHLLLALWFRDNGVDPQDPHRALAGVR